MTVKKTVVQKTIALPKSMAEAQANAKEKPQTTSPVHKHSSSEVLAETKEVPALAETFDLPKLKFVLSEIIEDFKSNHKNLEITVLKQDIKLEGERIIFQLNGEIQEEIFHKLKPELLGILRRKLNNYSIALAAALVEEDEESNAQRLYTNTDKLRFLLQKSPALGELQKRFGLETDF
ncbi:DNA polymerase III subunit gamma/tau [Mongoliitalea daihaiensis]|uniref:DNA polymerase III subunit gamma/tau n=1 Tax=Mongoliitalea daihaiensis TaxID=2782006 RepID=UPI001F293846|nr:DNA polymerase III subunit gamma/tau [Mongoliitalea daihaiensis]UJP65289.1 DNA polymerase III subunit gamma/tau [Mongoliitalea daihaiensis]